MPLHYNISPGKSPYNNEMLDALRDGEVYTCPFTGLVATPADIVEAAKHYIRLLEEHHEKHERQRYALQDALAPFIRGSY